MFHKKSNFQIAVLGNMIRGGIGDEMVCIPCYYALRQIYPNAFITLLCKSKNTMTLLNYVPYIDNVIDIAANDDYKNKKFNTLLIIEHNNLEVLNLAKLIQAKRKIATLSQSLLFFRNAFLPYLKILRGGGINVYLNPYWKQTHNEIQRNLNLVRQMNPKKFDKVIKSLDFSSAQLLTLESSSCRINAFLSHLGKGAQYQRIIGIFPFAKSVARKINFTPKEWIALAKALCKEFPNFLFIFVNYRDTQYHFAPFAEENLKVFYNEQGLEDLIAFVRTCDGILGVDSGHIHLADNFRVPTLEIIPLKTSKQWGGGFYGGYFQSHIMPISWREETQKHLGTFLQKARNLMFFVQNHTKS